MIKRLPGGKLYTNSYVIADESTKEAAVIDPMEEAEEIKEFIEKNELKVKYILLTHAHGDHIGGLLDMKEYSGGQIGLHPEDEEMLNHEELNMSIRLSDRLVEAKPDILLTDDTALLLGEKHIRFFHTPGHTKGSICILFEDDLISGDTLFAGGIGRTDLYGGDHEALLHSVKSKLFVLPGHIKVHPGHGGATTIQSEKENNPYF